MEIFEININDLQPSQLYICSEKLSAIEHDMQKAGDNSNDPLPVKRIGPKIILTDGHTRAFCAFRKGIKTISAYWDMDELDWEAYEICIKWCDQENIHSVADLENRIISSDQYEILWRERCRKMHEKLAKSRQEITAKPIGLANRQG